MEINDRILLLFSCIAEIYIFYDFFASFFDVRKSFERKPLRYAFLTLMMLLLFGINNLGNATLNLFGGVILFILLIGLLFQGSSQMKIGYFFISYIILFGSEFIFAILLQIPSLFAMESSVLKLSDMPWQMLSMKLLTYILFAIVKQIPKKAKKRMNRKTFLFFLPIPIASLGLLLLSYYAQTDFSKYLWQQVLLEVCFVLLLFGNILIFYGFDRFAEEMEKSNEQSIIISRQQSEMQYFEQVEKMNNQYRAFVHDINHYLTAIGELTKNGQNDKVMNILEEMHVELERNEARIYSRNHVINAVLNEKEAQAERAGVTLDIQAEPGLEHIKIKDADMVVMLNNLLENAICAMESCENKSDVIVQLFFQNEGKFLTIKIENEFSGEIEMINGRLISSKRDRKNHGIGIQSVRDKAEKNGGYLQTEIENQLFKAILVLPTGI